MASKLDPVADLDTSKPILIVGPTASGKSRLALAAARRTGGPIVNADALQVYANWRILTARPTLEDEAAWPHLLYGHVSGDTPYSVGDWLREIEPLLTGPPPVIVGGTGLYFTALTEGLADIPPTPPHIRQEATRILSELGLAALLMDLDPETAARLDQNNPMRVQRAWEVLKATGRSLASWQSETGPPLLPLEDTTPLLLVAPKDWLTPRIETRFDQMIAAGALDEARQNLPTWDPKAPSSKAIGAAELIAYLGGTLTLDEARARAIVATRQYAKRQRSWFRARMSGWRTLPGAML